ncbi:MAG: sugar ABC transporter permease [Eubacteriales bacterium]
MKKNCRKMEIRENRVAYCFLIPWIIGMLVFYIYPFTHSLLLSFTNTKLKQGDFIGFQNFITLFTLDDRFIKSLEVTSKYALIGVPLKLMFALFLALILKNGSTFYRTALYIPSLVGGSIAAAVMWKQLFSKSGLFNSLLAIFGIEGKHWLGEPSAALNVLIILAIWQFGSSMVIFIAGLKNIPSELYEAASIDGASYMKQFINITLPMLSPVIQFNLILQLVGGFQTFTQGYIITGGGPMDETLFTVQYIYEQAFSSLKMGYASAMSWILFILIAMIAAGIFISSKYWVYYENE